MGKLLSAEKGVADKAPANLSADAIKADGKLDGKADGTAVEGAAPLESRSIVESRYFWPIVIVNILLVLVLGILLWRRYKRKKAQKESAQQAAVELTPEQQERQDALPKLFNAEQNRLKKNATGRDFLYRIPWCMAVGGDGVGQTTLIKNSGLHAPFTSEDEALAEVAGCHFHYFDQGIVLDVNGAVWNDEATLGALIAEVRRVRPRRPLDSLLLCIPASDLFGENRLSDAAAQKRGEEIYQRVQLVQRQLSLRIPIYVLITKCDLLPGFTAYSNALSPPHREQLLGWSNPEDLDKPYRPELVPLAFAQLYQAQCKLQFDLLAARKQSESERDAVFLLPRNLNELCAPLSLILDQVFRATVYSETTVLRGIYMCGDTTVRAAGGQEMTPPRPAFVNHLFAKKIFPEFGLSRPLASGLLSAQNLINLVKAAAALTAIICIAVLWGTTARLQGDTQSVIDFLEKIPRKNNIQESGLQERERYARRSERLLNAMAQVPARSLRRITLPTSWVSDIDDDVRELILRSFESVILSGIRSGLEYKATQLFGLDAARAAALSDPNYEPPPEGEVDPRAPAPVQRERPTTPPKVLAFANMPEYQELRALGSNYVEFGQYVESYNRLGSDRRKHMDTVAPLVKYVFRIELGEDFNKNRAFYEEALENATHRTFDMGPVTVKVREQARQVASNLSQRLFDENPVELGLSVSLSYLNRLRTENDSGTPDLANLIKLREVLVQLEQDLGRTELGWLARDKLDLGEPYRDLRGTLRSIGGSTMADSIDAEWNAAFARLRRKIFEYQAPGLGQLLAKDSEKGTLILSPGIASLRTALDGFLGQSFVQQNGEHQQLTTPDGAYRVSWNEETLRQAVQLSDAYAAFIRDRLPPMYPDIREVVRGTALERLGNSMPILVAQARRIERITRPASDVQALQDILSGEVSDLKRVGGLLRQILDLYERASLKSQHSELYRQLQDDTREILRRLDLILDKDDLYRVSAKLAQWRGLRPPSFDTFDVDDGEGLNQYLKAQRTTIRNLARDFAKTPVSMLDGIAVPGGGASSDPLFNKWRNIVAEVEHFEAMTPGNSVKELESFVDTGLSTITPENCQERLPRRTGDSRDFFLASRARVYDAVRKRCSQFVEERLLESYDRLAVRFNKTLAGRFPFSRTPSSLDEEEANPRDVRAFFAEYDQFLPKYDAFASREETPGLPAMAAAQRNIASFMEAMRNVRPFFAPLLNEKSTDNTTKYNLGVEYRVNRQAEINGNQIAEWSLAVSDQRVDDTQTTWALGDKLRLSMRWAKDGPYRPAQNDQVKGASVDGSDTVSFEWGGYWGILRFLRIHRSLSSDLRKAVDRQPHILKFVIEIVERKRSGRLRLLPDAAYNRKEGPTTAAKAAFIFNRAVVYVRFALSTGESKDAIVVPAEWPATAPLSKEQSFQ